VGKEGKRSSQGGKEDYEIVNLALFATNWETKTILFERHHEGERVKKEGVQPI